MIFLKSNIINFLLTTAQPRDMSAIGYEKITVNREQATDGRATIKLGPVAMGHLLAKSQ